MSHVYAVCTSGVFKGIHDVFVCLYSVETPVPSVLPRLPFSLFIYEREVFRVMVQGIWCARGFVQTHANEWMKSRGGPARL